VVTGDLVRLTAHGEVIPDGELAFVTDTDIGVRPLGRTDTIRVAVREVGRAKVGRGHASTGTRTIGQAALAGAAILVVVGGVAARKVGWGLVFGAVGGTLGTMLGTGAALYATDTSTWLS
jgi:hypothetical protein